MIDVENGIAIVKNNRLGGPRGVWVGISGKFNEDLFQVFLKAAEHALQLRHTWIGTEDLLLGVIAEGSNTGLLRRSGVGYRKVHNAVVEHFGRYDRMEERPRYTPRAAAALKSAGGIAFDAGEVLRPRHILGGLIAQRECTGVAMLRSLGVDVDKLAQVIASPVLGG